MGLTQDPKMTNKSEEKSVTQETGDSPGIKSDTIEGEMHRRGIHFKKTPYGRPSAENEVTSVNFTKEHLTKHGLKDDIEEQFETN